MSGKSASSNEHDRLVNVVVASKAAAATTPGSGQMYAAMAFAMAAVVWNNLFQIVTERVVQPMNQTYPPDLSHSLADGVLARLIPSATAVDALLLTLLLLAFLRFLLIGSWSLSLTVLRRYLILQGIVFTLRGPALYMTVLPKTLTDPAECLFVPSSSLLLDALMILFRQKVTCCDMFFSGHAAMITLWASLVAQHTTPATFAGYRGAYLLFMTLNWSLTLITLALIPLTKFHYSIDLYIGVLLSWILFRMYYDTVAILPLYRQAKASLSWPQRLIAWLEGVQS